MTDPHAMLLSVRPNYVEALLNGSKTVELRRTRMRLEPGSKILIYSSSPSRQLVAEASLSHIEENEPAALWEQIGELAGVTRAEYDAYFAGASRAFGLHLRSATPLATPVTLASLRKLLGSAPPQSFRYLTAIEADSIAQLVA